MLQEGGRLECLQDLGAVSLPLTTCPLFMPSYAPCMMSVDPRTAKECQRKDWPRHKAHCLSMALRTLRALCHRLVGGDPEARDSAGNEIIDLHRIGVKMHAMIRRRVMDGIGTPSTWTLDSPVAQGAVQEVHSTAVHLPSRSRHQSLSDSASKACGGGKG